MKKIAAVAIFLTVFVMLFSLCDRILSRKETEGWWNVTAKIDGFYNSPKNEYDVIFQERNRYAGILLRLEVDGSFSQQSEILRVTRDLSLREDEDYDPNEDIFVSDVTQFHVANENDCRLDRCITENSNYDLWDEALAYFLPDNNAPSPTEFSTGESSINLSFTPSTNGHTVLWMFINYDSELVQAKIGSSTVTLNELISVVPDCNIIKVIAS